MSSGLSRTPILAGLAGLTIVLLPLNRPSTYVILVLALVVGLCGWFTADAVVGNGRLLGKVLTSATKTGDVSEVTSLTGRTEIWSYAIKMIAERPIFGWGTGSAAVTFGTLSGHAHNILLQPTVALGIPGGILVAALLVWNLFCLFQYPNTILHAFLAFLFVLGLVETPLLGAFPDAMTPIWIAVCFWPIEINLWEAETAMIEELLPDDSSETIVDTEINASETMADLPVDVPKTTAESSA